MLTYLIIATALGIGPAPKDNDEAFKPSEVAATLRATLPELSPTLPLRRAPAPTFERD